MKTDWSQMKGYWVSMDERQPPCNGIYHVTTTNLNERCLRWDGKRWNISDNRDFVVYWWDTADPKTGIIGPLELI